MCSKVIIKKKFFKAVLLLRAMNRKITLNEDFNKNRIKNRGLKPEL